MFNWTSQEDARNMWGPPSDSIVFLALRKEIGGGREGIRERVSESLISGLGGALLSDVLLTIERFLFRD